MLFAYKAKSKDGTILEGVIEAVDRFSLSRDLRAKGSTPISINEKGKNFIDSLPGLNDIFDRVSTEELIIFSKNLSGMIKAGLSLSRALSVLQKQTKKKSFEKVIVSLAQDVNSGETLSSGLTKFPKVFSTLFVSMTRAGEESGNLANALLEIGQNLEKSYALTRKIKGALIYPGVIMCAMVVIGVLMFAFVVPTLAKTFKELGVELPATTRMIIALGNFFSNNLLLTFVILVLAGFGLFSLFRAKFMAKYVDFVVLKLPVIGTLAKEINTSRTTRTIGSLLLSGVSITRAVEISSEVVQNVYYKKVLAEERAAIEKGASFGEIFKAHPELYPIMMSEMVEVGEETGKLSDMLFEVAMFYEEDIENKTKNLSTIIEPLLMIFIGASVGFFAISMISPLYSILNNIN